ncbi:hypothetical protein ACFPRA_22520 [Sporosarcina soli]|uniref:Uncharacterized protein n=1 Tax=Sporosarcina soli TaxID=334736 RepID=A0ABW0TQ85_9BACL
MRKTFRPLITKGIKGLSDEDKNTLNALVSMFRIARACYEKSYFIVFKKDGDVIVVTDGNDNVFNELDIKQLNISESIWLVTEDYGDELVCVAMLPEEY